MAKRGRKRKLTDESRARILDVLGNGGSRNLAAKIVGVATRVIADEGRRNPEFLHALIKAEAECEEFHLKRIKGGERMWQSSAWFLERKWPKRYARREPSPPKPPDNEDIRVRAVLRKMIVDADKNGNPDAG